MRVRRTGGWVDDPDLSLDQAVAPCDQSGIVVQAVPTPGHSIAMPWTAKSATVHPPSAVMVAGSDAERERWDYTSPARARLHGDGGRPRWAGTGPEQIGSLPDLVQVAVG